MPSNRRFKVTILLLVIFSLVLFYRTSAARQTRSSAFYTSTTEALAQRAEEERDGKALESNDLEVHQRLKAAEEAAKKAADKKGHEFHGDGVKSAAEKAKSDVEAARAGVGDVVSGRPRRVLNGGSPEKILMEGDDKKEVKKKVPESKEDREAKEEMNYILKRSPSMPILLQSCLIAIANCSRSHNILQNLLPVFEKGKRHSSQQVPDHTTTPRCRTR
jgi:hypothetical protein